jgi:hypothetical protein
MFGGVFPHVWKLSPGMMMDVTHNDNKRYFASAWDGSGDGEDHTLVEE